MGCFQDSNAFAIRRIFRSLAEESERPGPILLIASAAIANMYKGRADPTKDEMLKLLKQALIRINTKKPRLVTPVFPVDQLCQYLRTLGDNTTMPIDQLRSKTMALLALVGLFRPSDLAKMTADLVTISDSSIAFINWGGKTDKSRDGLPTTITCADDPVLCPVKAFQSYFSRTAETRNSIGKQPIWFSLVKGDLKGLSADRVAKLLKTTLENAQIDEVTARSFRTTGASAAIKAGADPDLIMKLGRWKSSEVFFKHYVNWEDAALTNIILPSSLPPSNNVIPNEFIRDHSSKEGDVRNQTEEECTFFADSTLKESVFHHRSAI